jgi:ABC-2 type transport system ATP-binding protein
MLETRNLTKLYSGVAAVKEVSFTVRPGEVLGYLGPNGSGKTTTVSMVIGLLEPTHGTVLFEGHDIQEDLVEFRRRVGYVPEEPHLYPFLSGREYLQLVGRLRGLPAATLEKKIDGFLQLLSLETAADQSIGSYSKGMKQKILISAALLHDPDLLIFDEPLSGLDITTAIVFRHLVSTLAAAGKIILYSSHVLEVVEKICSRVVVLYKGRIVAHDSVERLRDLMALESLEEVFSQLVEQQDPERTAQDIVGVMRTTR